MERNEVLKSLQNYFEGKGLKTIYDEKNNQLEVSFSNFESGFIFNLDEKDPIVWYSTTVKLRKAITKAQRSLIEKELIKYDSIFDMLYVNDTGKELTFKSALTIKRIVAWVDWIYDEMENGTNPIAFRYIFD